jgi:hypothetical protein
MPSHYPPQPRQELPHANLGDRPRGALEYTIWAGVVRWCLPCFCHFSVVTVIHPPGGSSDVIQPSIVIVNGYSSTSNQEMCQPPSRRCS